MSLETDASHCLKVKTCTCNQYFLKYTEFQSLKDSSIRFSIINQESVAYFLLYMFVNCDLKPSSNYVKQIKYMNSNPCDCFEATK